MHCRRSYCRSHMAAKIDTGHCEDPESSSVVFPVSHCLPRLAILEQRPSVLDRTRARGVVDVGTSDGHTARPMFSWSCCLQREVCDMPKMLSDICCLFVCKHSTCTSEFALQEIGKQWMVVHIAIMSARDYTFPILYCRRLPHQLRRVMLTPNHVTAARYIIISINTKDRHGDSGRVSMKKSEVREVDGSCGHGHAIKHNGMPWQVKQQHTDERE